MAAVAAVAAVAGSSVGGFSVNSQQAGQQQSSVTSTTNTGTGASNEVLSMAELAAGTGFFFLNVFKTIDVWLN